MTVASHENRARFTRGILAVQPLGAVSEDPKIRPAPARA
jgi:hypothetical protein